MRRRDGYWSPPAPALRGLPELLYVGHMTVRSASRIGAHRHDGWELCHIERGRTQWLIDGRALPVRGGDLVVIPPHALHDGWQPGCYRYLGLRLARGALLGLPRAQASLVVAALGAAAARPRPLTLALRAAWLRLDAAWRSRTPSAEIAARAALLEILAAIAAEEPAAQGTSTIARRAIELFDASDSFIPVGTMARTLRCSPSHLKASFRQHTGLPPAEYHRRQRIARAWRELRSGGRSITAIAFAYGFPSSQHFATAFKRVTGMRPSDARHRSTDGLDLPGS